MESAGDGSGERSRGLRRTQQEIKRREEGGPQKGYEGRQDNSKAQHSKGQVRSGQGRAGQGRAGAHK
eukprot:755537-Hanusia_phi.AAC.2